jgi:cell division septation protein DedD
MTQTWIVRVGLASRQAAAFVNPPALALGWANVSGLGDLTQAEHDEVLALVGKANPTAADPDAQADQLLAFRDDIAVDDLVVAPDAQSGDVLVGVVTGDYAYDPAASDYYPHRRAVTWHGRVRAADIPPGIESDTRGNLTLRRSDGTGDEWLALALAATPAKAPRRSTRSASGTKPAAKKPAAAKKPTTPKPAAKKKPEPQPDRVCASCGYSWPASQFAGGDLCVECRS